MIVFGNYIISEDLITEKFFCDINRCKGMCCVEGDGGAPLTEEEINYLEKNLDKILKYLSDNSIKTISSRGFYYIDSENEPVTQLNNGKECVFATFQDGIVKCAIQLAYFNKEIEIEKPASCALYPIRVKKYRNFIAVNVHKWEICNCSFEYGRFKNIDLLDSCKMAIIKHLGIDFYKYLINLKQKRT